MLRGHVCGIRGAEAFMDRIEINAIKIQTAARRMIALKNVKPRLKINHVFKMAMLLSNVTNLPIGKLIGMGALEAWYTHPADRRLIVLG